MAFFESEANRFAAELLMPTEWFKIESRNKYDYQR
ncbi:ImmA/IrrE family metallo-endopeptidase [Escherichia coli]|nr:ImmA/IrrE family metallo-endopeptidase [Escherichia coli]EFZ2274469.1 ImmA/IrrE family metallo-endopeptidase [Shigella sonnei]EFF0757390.1 ImmA/IrrE family metallo-endopeptidase [Escherichia coli]EFF4923881.1 ImmA/IrrE family metallo-endopeptidase [Escherichia coli]EFG0060561.1 ImmA/IrrE family metallo-endopeptidase [Escherichia coli]